MRGLLGLLRGGRSRRGRGHTAASQDSRLVPYEPAVPAAVQVATPAQPSTGVVLCFADGSSTELDPRGDAAAALQTLAVRLRERGA